MAGLFLWSGNSVKTHLFECSCIKATSVVFFYAQKLVVLLSYRRFEVLCNTSLIGRGYESDIAVVGSWFGGLCEFGR